MRIISPLLVPAFVALASATSGCTTFDDARVDDTNAQPNGTGSTSPAATSGGSQQPSPAGTDAPVAPAPSSTSTSPPGADNPGPKPAGCAVTKDADGFFTRTTAKSPYVGYVPKSYTGQPSTLVVAIHGCGDSAMNFATWAASPYGGRDTQTHLAISIGGRDGECWSVPADADKVLAAITDMSSCFYVHQQKIVLAGYSSGGMLAYHMGLTQSAKFAGIIIENSGIGNVPPSGASWKINVAHIAHTSDQSFPIAGVKADWAKLEAAGIPVAKSEVPGTHDGNGDDWSKFLLPKIGAWKAP